MIHWNVKLHTYKVAQRWPQKAKLLYNFVNAKVYGEYHWYNQSLKQFTNWGHTF